MANLFISSLISKVATELDVLIHNEVGLAWNSSKSEKKKLISLLSILNPMLHEVEGKPTYSQAMLQWLQKSRIAADAAMILLAPASNSNNKVGSIRTISRSLEDILKEKNTVFKIEETKRPLACGKETDSSPPPSIIYERVSAKEEIVKFLLDDTCHENVSVIPIVGIPGIWKTALAKLAFNDQKVKECFEKCFMIWVWIADCLDVEKIAYEILESGLGISGDYSNFDAMKTTLWIRLHEKKILLVLDNVCNDETGSWNELCDVLRGAKHGSKVIVTTSNNRVAETMRTTMPYNVESLTGAVCELIFESLAFQEGRNTNRIYQDIGNDIANKSKGVPRVAEDLGRLMMHKKDPAEWRDTQTREIWNLSEANQILHMLRSSYKNLPSYAYRCFTYCSIFPRNYEIDKDMIIKYWIALDLILLEDQGRDAICHLFDRFFFVPLQTDEAGFALTFKLHELVYDLARYEMRTGIAHHFCNYVKTAPNVPKEAPNTHLKTYSFLNSCQRCISEGPPPTMNELKLLRVLDMSYARDTSYLNSVAELHQLRFINLSGTDIENLPSSISRLSNLQSLILRNCLKLTELPNDTWKMHSLRHLDIEGCRSLHKMPPAIGQLKFLQTLPVFIVGRNGSTIGELGTLNLQRRLHIKHLGNVAKIAEVECANLENKKRLTALFLSWDDDNNRQLNGDAAVLNALQPHSYLTRLSIVGYKGRGFPDWLNTAYLQNLTEISLSNCSRCLHPPPLGELPYLKNLTIEGFDTVIHIGRSLYGERRNVVFPSLEKFTCSTLICLTDWEPESRVPFPNLSTLIIKKCPKLTNIPRLPWMQNKLEYLEIEDCPRINSITEISSLHALKTLKFIHCEGLTYLPEGLSNLSFLSSLEIDNCLSLTSIPLEGLRSLQYLSIQKCEDLTSAGGLNHLRSLRELEIDGCPNLQSSTNGRESLEFLQSLTIRSCPELTFFPWGPLEHLEITSCSRIFETSEWAENLTLQESLKIEDCKNLANLPSEMKTMTALRELQIIRLHDLTALPDWLTSLTSVEYVSIKYCYLHKRMSHKLSKWCKERSKKLQNKTKIHY